jgi:hypothetical protein
MKNNLKEVQDLMLKQMKRLDSCTAKSEIQLEVGRSGALSQNAQAYLKSMSIGLRVKELAKMNPNIEEEVLEEIGAVTNE